MLWIVLILSSKTGWHEKKRTVKKRGWTFHAVSETSQCTLSVGAIPGWHIKSYHWKIPPVRDEISCKGGLDLSNFSWSLEFFFNGFHVSKTLEHFLSLRHRRQSQRWFSFLLLVSGTTLGNAQCLLTLTITASPGMKVTLSFNII